MLQRPAASLGVGRGARASNWWFWEINVPRSRGHPYLAYIYMLICIWVHGRSRTACRIWASGARAQMGTGLEASEGYPDSAYIYIYIYSMHVCVGSLVCSQGRRVGPWASVRAQASTSLWAL